MIKRITWHCVKTAHWGYLAVFSRSLWVAHILLGHWIGAAFLCQRALHAVQTQSPMTALIDFLIIMSRMFCRIFPELLSHQTQLNCTWLDLIIWFLISLGSWGGRSEVGHHRLLPHIFWNDNFNCSNLLRTKLSYCHCGWYICNHIFKACLPWLVTCISYLFHGFIV